MIYQNFHKHTSLSHRYNKDSPLVHMDYFKYIKETYGNQPQIYSTVEHGWQGNYFKIYDELEKFNKKNETNIKFIFGTEAYWVKDRFEKDGTNCHIILLAKNDNGRKKLNRAIYESYKTGYYYKGRMDLDLLLSLPKEDIFVTTACVAFWGYDKHKVYEEVEQILAEGDGSQETKIHPKVVKEVYYDKSFKETDEVILKLANHFTDFYLEVQSHNTDLQRDINKHIVELHEKYNIPYICGVDSHIIDENNMEDREDLLRSNNIKYDEEDGWYMDYPTIDVLIDRFKKQGVLSDEQIEISISNTNKILEFEDIVLDRKIKVPVAKKYKHLPIEERNKIFRTILQTEWKEQISDINRDKYEQYITEIKHDMAEIEGCQMADYFIDNYEIMKLGIEKGGILTPSGRGSAVSMYLNKLLRFTKVDKVNSPVLMYSERFLTRERILDSKTPPDVDHNVSQREPFIEAQKEIICEEGTFDLLALGTLHYKSAFKMYARAYSLDPTLANEVTKQISSYENDLKYIEDEDEKDLMDIYDYVDKEKYGHLIDGCQQYMGIVDTVKSHPCFTKDALVMTDIGYKKISEINVGDNVLTINNQFKKVLKTMDRESDNIYSLTIQGSTPIEVTGNHPFYTSQRTFKRKEYSGKRNRRELLDKKWKNVDSLEKGDLIGIAINQKEILPNLQFVDSKSNDFWWSVGRYLGDGWRSHTIRKSGKSKGQKIKDVIICCNKNNNETDDILKHLTWCKSRVSKEKTVNKIYLKKDGLYSWLNQFGDYANGKHLTNEIIDLPKEQLSSFLDGYFSADGHYEKNSNRQKFTTISKELGLGVVACVNKAYERPCSFSIRKKSGIEYIQGRKVNCKEKYSGSFNYENKPQDRAFVKDGYIWTPYKSKTKLNKKETVYNLEVEDNHTYTVNNLIVHNCGTLCYDGDAIEDVGVIMVRSESTGRECFVALIESGTIDAFGYLKQDYLIVDSIGLTYKIYDEIGIEPMSVNKLLDTIKTDTKTWDIYKDGYTMCVNQAEQPKSTKKVKVFMPKNISELTQWISGIRPAFKSMYKIFEGRQHFDYGIKAFDNLIQDEYCDSSFILYQEHLMKVLAFAGFEVGETYNIIKAISKKKEYIIKDAKEKFIPNFAKAILETKETDREDEALKLSETVWTIVENSASYGFNCVSKDTKIKRSSPNGKFEPTVEEMYKIMNDINYAKETNHYHLHQKYNRYGYGTALSMGDDEIVRENKIIDITPSGIRQTYKVVTKNGSNIVCTDNHKFPTKNGEVKLSNLKVGDNLYCLGKYKQKKFDSSLTNGDFESNLPIKGQMGFQYKPNGVSVVYDEIRLSNKENKCCCEICNKEYSDEERFELHHKDFDRKNNSRANFQWLCVSCHKKEHYKNGRTKRYENGIPTYLDEIVSIEPYKIEQTYNVEMADPNHNFISESGLITSNSAHAYCMAIDSVTLAWQKAHYPLEFYKIALQWYTDKGKKDKVSNLKQEMLQRGIQLKPIKFGDDNRVFSIDKDANCINQTMSSIKDMQTVVPEIVYEIGLSKPTNFMNVLGKLANTKMNKKSLDILIRLNYFSEFGHPHQLQSQVKIYADLSALHEKFKTCKQLNKLDCILPIEEVVECCGKQTEKQFREIDNDKLLQVFRRNYPTILKQISAKYPYAQTTTIDLMQYEVELLRYTDIKDASLPHDMYMITKLETNNWGTCFASLYQCNSGIQKTIKFGKIKKKPVYNNDLAQGNIVIVATDFKKKGRYDENHKWIESNEYEELIISYAKIK